MNPETRIRFSIVVPLYKEELNLTPLYQRTAGLSLFALLALGSAQPSAVGSVELKPQGDRIDVLIGGRPFTTYYFGAATAKPYLFPLRSAQGTIVTRGFPMETSIPGEDHDEPHQRAMHFAHGDINAYDFWGEAEFPRWSRHSVSTFGAPCSASWKISLT